MHFKGLRIFCILKVWGAVSFGPLGVNCEDRPYSAEAAVYSVRDWISQNAGEECNARMSDGDGEKGEDEEEKEGNRSVRNAGNHYLPPFYPNTPAAPRVANSG